MDVSSFTRLEAQYGAYTKPYHTTFVKPLVCKPHLELTRNSKPFPLPYKLKVVSELLENDATASTSTNSDKTITKLNGKISGGPSVIKRNIKVNGNGATTTTTTNEQGLSEQAIKILSQGEKGIKVLAQGGASNVNGKGGSSSCVSVEEASSYTGGASSSQGAWAASCIMQDADISYLKLMQGLYLRDHSPKEGLGIVEFLKGKNLFITGATGFLAKVLVEKILRVQPDVGQLFLLIKGKDTQHVKKRLHEEIIHSHLFNHMKSSYGDSYQQFMERKLTPVLGNIAANNLGMDAHTIEALQRQLDIVINSAASTTFDERYDHALNLNTKGAQRVVEFGRSCLHLQLLMHVSTAFVNGQRKGVVEEKAFKIGCSIANEQLKPREDMEPDIDVEMESRFIETKANEILNKDQSNGALQMLESNDQQKEKQLQETMRELGMERAKSFGWQDTYVFTKAMGEMLVDSTRGQLPVVIVRPSVVESSFKDPFPGWMEGNRMMDPIIISYGKGQLPGFLVDPQSVLDVVPVDMVANAMLAAMARHAGTPGLEVYQVASSVVNPLTFVELARMSCEHFDEHPFTDNAGNPLKTHNLQLFQDMDSFINAVTICPQSTKEKNSLKWHNQLTLKVKQQAAYLANLYRPYTFYAGRFDNSKTRQLFGSLSSQEKELFGFNVSEIDWEAYIKRTHIPGLRKHVLKGRGSNIC